MDALDYAETLINVQKKIQFADSIISNDISAYLIGESNSILSYRVNYLLNKQIKQKTNKFLLFFLLLPILTNSIIFEAYYENPKNLNDTLSEQDLLNKNYLIQHKDGTYSLCNGKESFFIRMNPKSLIESGIKVVKE